MSDSAPARVRVIIVMGVAGAGKTLVGSALARALGWGFYDADDFHSPENVAKMHRGIGLTDADRAPWLAALRQLIERLLDEGANGVLACSALKEAYRKELTPTGGAADSRQDAVRFVYLNVPKAVLRSRLEHRAHHYAPPELLDSQLATLEPPQDAIWLDGTQTPDEIVRAARSALGL